MKISMNWLRELVATEVSDAEIAARLTAAGLEVEGETRLGDGLAGVLVAEVRGSRKHPRADKLTLVDVFDGRDVTEVVCGAPNVPGPGGKVAWARPGATLPGGITIAAKEVRGVVSPGMLCAEDELGLGESHAGILILDGDAQPGADVAKLLGLPDTVLEINVTPNRPDCMGHLGVAREVAALIPEARLIPPDADLAQHTGGGNASDFATVTIEDLEGCPRYLARILTGVKVGQSPLKVRLRLQALGVRAINDVVDATNLVLMETGQPLHAFDLDQLAGRAIVVRRPRDGEKITTLDGQERALLVDDVAVCDAARPVAVAGVMGGAATEVTDGTTRILLESAAFSPARIRRTARRLGLHGEASQRFERGVDPNAGVALASALCARRIAEWTGGRVAAGAVESYPVPIAAREVVLRCARAERVLGLALAVAEQEQILAALGLAPAVEGDSLRCRIPTFRPDLTREVDLIEEIVRVYGYDRVPATLPRSSALPASSPPLVPAAEAVRDALWSLGLDETISFSFVAPERIAALGFTDERSRPIRLRNPLREEQSAMRTSLLPGLLAALQRNRAHGVGEVRLFEIGAVFLPRASTTNASLPHEETLVAALISGRRAGWLKSGEELDFFDVKGIVDGLFERRRLFGVAFEKLADAEAPWLHPGLSASILVGGARVGVVGEIHPALREKLASEGRAFAFEIALDALSDLAPPSFAELPRFPASARDVSFFVDEAAPASAIAAVMAGTSPLIEAVRVLEDYREPGRVPKGKKGMLWSLSYRARERTLTDEEVTRDHAAMVEALRARFQIEPR